MIDDDEFALNKARLNWDRARQAAVFESILSVFSGRATELLSFEDVRSQLHLTSANYRGLQEIELARIRGSVGRYKDFTLTFLPRKEEMRERWQRVDAVAFSMGTPPVEVYQVGEAYFVVDGNHRVSVARRAGAATIHAHVWEYVTPVGLSAEAHLDELFIKAEYAEFLARTRLDLLRPDQRIVFTAPGRYREIEYQITLYRQALERIDGEPIQWEYAVTAWYDMVYTPAIDVIRDRDVLKHFPGRTEADLFVWVWRYHRELRERGIFSLAEAAEAIKNRSKAGFLRHLIGKLARRAGRTGSS
jgi:hypothetical protein